MSISYLLAPNRTALVVVDVQERLLPVIGDGPRLVNQTVKLIRIASLLGLPIIVSEQYTRGLGPTVEAVRQALIEGGAYEPVEKITFSAFGENAFESAVSATKARDLLICGIEAHVCVLQTALDGLSRGYSVHLIEDAAGSRDPSEADRARRRIADCGGVISSVEMAGYELLRTAGSPAFKKARPFLL